MGFGSSGELCSEVLEFLGDDDLRRVRRPMERFGFLISACVLENGGLVFEEYIQRRWCERPLAISNFLNRQNEDSFYEETVCNAEEGLQPYVSVLFYLIYDFNG